MQDNDEQNAPQNSPAPMRVSPTGKRVYSFGQVIAATIIGGPFAGVYMMSKNFKALNQQGLAQKSMQIGFALSALLFLILILLPDDIAGKIPTLTVPTAYTIAIIFAMKELQNKELNASINQGETTKHSIWRVLGISILTFLLTLAYMFVLALVLGLFLAG